MVIGPQVKLWEYMSLSADFNCYQSNGWTRKVNPKVICEWRQGWSGILWALKRAPDQRAAFLARKTFGYLEGMRHNCVLMIQCVNRDVYNSFQFKFSAHVRQELREFKFSAKTQLLMEALQRNAGTITVAKCTQWFRFMQTYLPRCINREVIEG